jgi:DNA-binding GntR family transcriptional regulator
MQGSGQLTMGIMGVTESLVQYLRDRIIIGELRGGQKLNEAQLSLSLGVSRPPLREAYRILERERLVFNVPRKGTYVTEISIENLQEVNQARQMIECCAIDLLKVKNIRDLPHVASALDAGFKLSVPSGDDTAQYLIYLKTFADYHIKLVESCGNGWLIDFYQAIASNLARYQFLYFHTPGTRETSLKDHRQVLNHIEAGDHDRAKEYLSSHIKYTFELLQRPMNWGKSGR